MKREQGRERGLTQRREGAKEEERNILPQRHEEGGFLPRRRACCAMLAFEGRAKSGKSLSHGRVRARCRGLHRSEEHTSELQSLMRISYAVFCLKKKNTQTQNKHKHELD